MVMKRKYLFLVIVFSVTCMILVQTNFDILFPNHEWASKLYTLSSLDSWTTANSRRTMLSRSDTEVELSGQPLPHASLRRRENENIDPEKDQSPKMMMKSRTGSEYQATSDEKSSQEELEEKDQFTIDISPLNWFKNNEMKDSYEKYFRSHLINYPYFGSNDENDGKKKPTDIVSILDKYNPLKVIPVVQPDQVSRIFLVTYFRSGSSFLGDLLQQNFRTFYTFEPLHYLESGKGNRIRDDKFNDALNLINNILKCNFPLITPYIKWVLRPENRFLFKWNTFLWSTCRLKPSSCFNPSFLKETCIRSPVQVMKFTRIHMRHLSRYFDTLAGNANGGTRFIHHGNHNLTNIKLVWIHGQDVKAENNNIEEVRPTNQGMSGPKSTLEQETNPPSNELDSFRNSIKVVFLVRDPRGIYNSRKNMTWCINSPCSNIRSLCKEMSQDLIEFDRLKRTQPDKFHLIRYEDLSLDPTGTTSELFSRLKFPFSSAVQRYLKSHTKLKPRKKLNSFKSTITNGYFWSPFKSKISDSRDSDPYGTIRNSKDVAFEWKNKLNKEELAAIEYHCSGVIDKLGYREI